MKYIEYVSSIPSKFHVILVVKKLKFRSLNDRQRPKNTDYIHKNAREKKRERKGGGENNANNK